MFIAGPDVSLNGSPTVSPTTAALCGSLPFPPCSPPSIAFFALSHAPPAFAMNSAIITPVTVAPASRPPSARTPKNFPTITGSSTDATPGTIISFSAAAVEISTQRAESGFTPSLPSSRPGISRNWRRTSSTMPWAARPTAVMVWAPTKNGITPPMKSPMTTIGSTRLMPVWLSPTAAA